MSINTVLFVISVDLDAIELPEAFLTSTEAPGIPTPSCEVTFTVSFVTAIVISITFTVGLSSQTKLASLLTV